MAQIIHGTASALRLLIRMDKAALRGYFNGTRALDHAETDAGVLTRCSSKDNHTCLNQAHQLVWQGQHSQEERFGQARHQVHKEWMGALHRISEAQGISVGGSRGRLAAVAGGPRRRCAWSTTVPRGRRLST